MCVFLFPHKVSGGMRAWLNLNLFKEFVSTAESPILGIFSKRQSDSFKSLTFPDIEDWI